ncbi:MAG TPA: hypothetical protein VD948_07475, partial [Rhodothermales bacterium]|nr:hypothetical protein [Rhodothermales bacterium]
MRLVPALKRALWRVLPLSLLTVATVPLEWLTLTSEANPIAAPNTFRISLPPPPDLLARLGVGRPNDQPSVEGVLDAEGQLLPGATGSFSAEGFSLAYGPDGAPRFVRTSVPANTWSTAFPFKPLNGTVTAIAISGSDVYVGGTFTNAGGNTSADRIARWDGTAWNALGSGLNGTVSAIAISDSDLYVGGSFTDAGGNTNADRIARWDGTSWNALGSGLGSTVTAIAFSGSNVYVGGEFTNAGGNTSADRIARWDGTAWNALG